MSNSRNSSMELQKKSAFILLVLLCIPQNDAYKYLDPILRMFRYLALMFSIRFFVAGRLYKKHQLYPVLLFFLWIIISSLLNSRSLVDVLKMIYPLFACVILTQYYVQNNYNESIKMISRLFAALVFINLITGVTHVFGDIYAGAWQGNYLFGIRVNVSFILPYALGLCLISYRLNKPKERLTFIIAIVSLTIFAIFEWVSTAVATIGFFLIMIWLMHVYSFKRKFLKTALLILVVFSVAFAFLISKVRIFDWFLIEVLKEDVTLDGRTILWEQVFDYLKGFNWIIGYGYKHDYLFKISWWFAADHPHNEYLEMLFCYGIVGIVLYLWIVVRLFKSAIKSKTEKIRDASIAALAAMIVMHIASHNYFAVYPYIFYVIILNAGKMKSRCFNKNNLPGKHNSSKRKQMQCYRDCKTAG